MAVFMLGGGGGGVPFNRTFFNVSLGELLEKGGMREGRRLTLLLIDGTAQDVSEILEIGDQYLVVRVYRGSDESAERRAHTPNV